LNNLIEQDHRSIKLRLGPMLGLKRFRSASITIAGIELQLKSATTSPTFLATGFQAITAETIEYSKKSLENGSAFVEKLLGAKSFQSAIHIRSEYAKMSYAALVAYLTKIGELNTKLAKEAFKRRSHVA